MIVFVVFFLLDSLGFPRLSIFIELNVLLTR